MPTRRNYRPPLTVGTIAERCVVDERRSIATEMQFTPRCITLEKQVDKKDKIVNITVFLLMV